MSKKTTSIILSFLFFTSNSATTILLPNENNINVLKENYPDNSFHKNEFNHNKIKFFINTNLNQKLKDLFQENIKLIQDAEEKNIIYRLKKGLPKPENFKDIILETFTNLFSKEGIVCGTIIMSLGLIYKILSLEAFIIITKEAAKTWRWKIIADTIKNVTGLISHITNIFKPIIDKVDYLLHLTKLNNVFSYISRKGY